MQVQEEQSDERTAAQVMSAEVLATVSHELRSPLASIKGYTATLLRQGPRLSAQERLDFLLAIKEASERLEASIDRFMKMSQLELHTLHMTPSVVDADRIAQEALLSAEQQAGERLPGSFAFHLRLKDEHGTPVREEPLVWADPRLLREVLDNLLDNAVNYSPDGGRIDIVIFPVQARAAEGRDDAEGRVPGGNRGGERKGIQAGTEAREMLDICVCDHGLGIAPDHLERIFDRFHREDTGLTRTVSGLGLGLTICKCIVEMHGGTIWAESCPQGGSAFHVLVPLAEDNEEDHAP